MTLAHEIPAATVPGRTRVIQNWSTSIRAACDTLSRMPIELMGSITVTGRLDGRRDEIRWLHELSHELATTRRLRAVIESKGSDFTVRFERVMNG